MSLKNHDVLSENRAPGVFGAPGCHPSTLIDLVKTALASKCSVKTICLISEGCRTHRAVTGPMSFKKSRRFVGKSRSRVFGAPGYMKSLYLTLQTLLWLVKFSKDHMHEFIGLENPKSCHWSDEFQKITTFCRKIVLPGFWGTWLYQSTLFDLANTVLASKGSVEAICMISVGYRTHRAVTGPMSFKKSRRFVGKPCSRVLGHLAAIQAH